MIGSKYNFKILLESLRHPITWCFGVHIALAELISFNLESTLSGSAAYSAASPVYYHLISLSFMLALLLCQRRIGALSKHRAVPVMGAVVGLAGMALAFLSGNGDPFAYRLVGSIASVAGMGVIFLVIMEYLSEISMAWAKAAITTGSAINVLMVPLYLAPKGVVPLVSAVLFALCVALIFLAWRDRGNLMGAGFVTSVQTLNLPYRALFGVVLIGFSFAFLQTQLYLGEPIVATAVIGVTKAAAVVIFAAVLFGAHDFGYAPSLKIVGILMGAGLVMGLVSGFSFAPRAATAVGYSLFEMVGYLLLTDIAAHTKISPLKVCCLFYSIESAAYAAAGCLSLAVSSFPMVAEGISAILVVALMVVSTYYFDEKRFASFFHDAVPAVAAPSEQVKSFRSAYAAAMGLSERETEVLELYAGGRSAVFIAEALCISPNTVRARVRGIYEKCGVHSRQELLSRIEDFDLEAARPDAR